MKQTGPWQSISWILLIYSRKLNANAVSAFNRDSIMSTGRSLVDSKRAQTKYKLVYSPVTEFAKEIAETVTSELELNNSVGYDNQETLQNQFDDRTTLAGVIFDRLDNDNEGVPKVLSVSIRFPSEFRTISPFLTEERLWLTRCSGVVNPKRDNVKDEHVNQDIYIREGFLQLQHQIFLAWFHKIRTQDPTNYTEPQAEVFNVRLRMANERCFSMDFDSIPSFLFNFIYLLPFINVIRVSRSYLRSVIQVTGENGKLVYKAFVTMYLTGRRRVGLHTV